jgi:hypothetical protein
MFTNSSTEKSARKWADWNLDPQTVDSAVNEMLCFLAECNERDGSLWLNGGWGKIWERIQENKEN